MPNTKRTLVGAAVAATTALTLLSVGPAQGATGKGQYRPTAANVDQSAAPDRIGAGRDASSPAARAALAAIQNRIERYVATRRTKFTFGSYLDSTGKIVIETNAPASVVSSLTAVSRTANAESEAAARVQVRRVTTSDAFHRRDDIPPFWGGGGIKSGGAVCSSGYAVRNSAGTVSMVTAGHCFANGATVLTESGARTYGTVSNRRLPTVNGEAKDMELIGGQSYSGRIFTGGVTSTTSAPVVAAGSAFVGFNNYCHSGRTTGENCGHTATSTNAQVCTQTGCKSPVISFTGGTLSQPGDSGSPFYAKDSSGGVWIRGHVIAGNSSTAYAQPWTVVASTYGVSIVTG